MADNIVIPCSECGRDFTVPGTAAGSTVRCPKCKKMVAIPGGSSSTSFDTGVVGANFAGRTPDAPAPNHPGRAANQIVPHDDDWLEEDDSPSSMDDGSSVPTLQGLRSTTPSAYAKPIPAEATKGSIATGILMMVGAVVWFFAGLALNRVFFYPLIMFVIGFVTMVKGAMKKD